MRQVDDRAVLGDDRPVARHPGRHGQVAVGDQVPDLAVHRHHVARADQVVDVEQLAGGSVAGDVHQCVALVHHLGAQPGQPVDHSVHRALVARDQRAGQDDGVAPGEGDHGMFAVGHPGQRRQRLALRPGGDDHHLFGPVLLDVAQLDQGVARYPQVAEVTGHTHVAQHRAADVDDLPAVRHRRVEHLLHPVHVRGEAGHDHPLPADGEDPLQHRGDVPLRRHEAGDLGVGGVDHQQVDALGADPGEGPQVGQPAVQRQLVGLEVAGVQDRAGRRPHRHGQRVGNRVVDGEELQVESADRDPVAFGHYPPLRVAQPVLAELLGQQGEGQLGADQRDVRPLPEQVGHRADVILVAVGQHQPDDVVQPMGDGVEPRQDQVDPRMVVLGEQHAAVDQQQLTGVLQHRHVPPDIAQTTERNDPHRVGSQQGRTLQTTGGHGRQGYTSGTLRRLIGEVGQPP